ncbi:hypothetical protein WJX79_004411 [Trebouxia sp. C0005]
MVWLSRARFGKPEPLLEVAEPVNMTTSPVEMLSQNAFTTLAVTENRHFDSIPRQDKLTSSARLAQDNTEVNRMIDPWWLADMHCNKMLIKREQLVQALKDHEEKMAAKVAYWETEVLPQRGLAVPAFAAPRLQQELLEYQESTFAKLGQMKEALVDPAVRKSQAEVASITRKLGRELEKAEQLIVTTKSRLANEQAGSQSLAMALLEARAANEEQLAKLTAQLAVQIERACSAEALADIKAGLLADEHALSSSLAQDKRALEERLLRQETRHVTSIAQLGDGVTFFSGEFAALQARHQEVLAAAAVTTSERQRLQDALTKSDQAVLSLQMQLQQEADHSRDLAKGSHTPNMATSPSSNAASSATPSSAQPSSGPGSTDESWQSSKSDHICSDLASDEDEDGNTEYSMSTDKDDVHNQRGALSYFLPAAMPHIPHDIARKVPGIQEVAQLASHQWHHRLLAVLEHYHIPWKGSWDLAPLDFAPQVFTLVAKSLSTIGQGSFGRVHFGQRWVGWGSPGSPQLGWPEGWEPVAIKIVPNSDHAQREVAALQRVQQALEQLHGSRHVIQHLESHIHTTRPTGASQMYIVTRYEEGHDLVESFNRLRRKWSEQVGSVRERGRAQWLAAVKEATRQALKGLNVIHGCGLVHGDIKTNNFQVNMKPDGSRVHLVITDLGNCCAAGSDHTCMIACPLYTSPEGLNYFNKPQEYMIHSAADIFSMGCVLYELLTRTRAFMRPEDGDLGDLTFDEIHQLALWRQAQWDTDSSQGRPLPYGSATLWESIPDDTEYRQAVDLLQRMLKMEPNHRPSAQELLAHPFLDFPEVTN